MEWLPDGVLLSCFARVSRLYYPTLSLVSKRFRSLLASPEIHKARSLLAHTETCLYVFFESYPRSHWYTLCLKPNQTLPNDTYESNFFRSYYTQTPKKKSSGYVLARVPIPSSPHVRFPGLVAVGYIIYGIEEISYFSKKEDSYSDVWILDCRTHTWCEAPSLPKKEEGDSGSLKNTFEVFETKTQIWDTESITLSETEYNSYNSISTCIDGKFHVMKTGTKGVAYNSKESSWDLIGREMDTEKSLWRCLKGLVGLPYFTISGARIRLADYGGKMVILWEGEIQDDPYDLRYGGGYKNIWCAEIALERRISEREIWGTVEWFDHVLTVPKACYLVKVLDVTV
ncbi:unnamed protein product [Microthlaspi erraticum]|uniref:F-box domain-containing protein n=1 Tax=Microthlaspi erraticum TaxID=1685480 RepID=A0A6D2ILY6_9BRAS|nr:unnamed protein product [Microthlaspi erraticum]